MAVFLYIHLILLGGIIVKFVKSATGNFLTRFSAKSE